MNYDERQREQLLREADQDLLAVLAVNLETDEFEVIYSDGYYKEYGNQFHHDNFFYHWANTGIKMVREEERSRMLREISSKNLRMKLSESSAFETVCSFVTAGGPAHCRVRAVRSGLEAGTAVISIRNIESEVQLEIRSLNGQMKPHFMYNALSSIREVVLTDPEYGADMLFDFTTHLRAGIRATSPGGLIPFSQELENVRAYVNIEKMRLGDRLKVIYDIGYDDFEVLPLTVQPIAENAIRHGIFGKGAAGGTVAIRTRREGGYIEITVSDDGMGFDPNEVRTTAASGEKDSAGLANLTYRLEKLMCASVEIWSGKGQGTVVTVRIPEKAGYDFA